MCTYTCIRTHVCSTLHAPIKMYVHVYQLIMFQLLYIIMFLLLYITIYHLLYHRPGFNCVVKQLRFWLFKVDCKFKDCDLRVMRIGHTCVIYTLRSNNCELREKSQFAIIKLRN